MGSLTGSGSNPRGTDSARRQALASTLPLGRMRRATDGSPAALPERIGRFEVRGLLGEGAMGRVFRAYDPLGRREVAVKTLKAPFASEPLAITRLRREAEALRRLSHPAFVAIHEVARDHIVQDLVEGESLGTRLRRKGRLAPAEALPILEALAGALDHIHARGIVHRDVKPENVMLTRRGEVKITDFGLAHLAWAPLTGSHEMLGSPAYMAPEQITLGEVEPRSDLYALGVVAYEMLTGTAPFRTATIGRLLEIIVREPAPAVTATCPDLPAAVDPILATALAKDPWDRFPSGRTFVAALRAALAPRSLAHRLWTSLAR
ncbi:MAG TPA: serine/threonine-protein kinase [Vicinamibacteria bacterium]